MNESNDSKAWYKLGWILALLLIGILAGIILSEKVLAIDWPFGKDNYCSFGNFSTQYDCDVSWCNNVISNSSNTCLWNNLSNFCSCTQIQLVNVTINLTSNETLNYTISLNTTDFYNKSDVEYFCRNYTDSQIVALRDRLLDRVDNITRNTASDGNYSYYQEPVSNSWPWWVFPITAVILLIGGAAITFAKKEKHIPHEESIRQPLKPSKAYISELLKKKKKDKSRQDSQEKEHNDNYDLNYDEGEVDG